MNLSQNIVSSGNECSLKNNSFNKNPITNLFSRPCKSKRTPIYFFINLFFIHFDLISLGQYSLYIVDYASLAEYIYIYIYYSIGQINANEMGRWREAKEMIKTICHNCKFVLTNNLDKEKIF